MRHLDPPARAGGHVVGVEAAHHAAVQVQADGTRTFARHAGDVDVVGCLEDEVAGVGLGANSAQ